jgi:hypothetical protein
LEQSESPDHVSGGWNQGLEALVGGAGPTRTRH